MDRSAVSAWRRRHPDAVDVLVSAAFGVVLFALTLTQRDTDPNAILSASTLGLAMAAVILWSLRRRRSQAERAAREVLEQRLAIARELHDVVGHHVSLIGIQAGAARRTLGGPGPATAEALSAIEASSRAAVTDMQRIVTTLRGGGIAGAGPAPTLADLPALVERVRDAGMPVELQQGAVATSPATETALFRIAQEALTNAARHAGPSTVVVTLAPAGVFVELVVENVPTASSRARRASGARSSRSGMGLPGMRERAAAVGGTVDAQPTDAGGFRVVARVPRSAA